MTKIPNARSITNSFGLWTPNELKKEILQDTLNEKWGTVDTAIRVIKIEKFQRYCLKCGKILPLEIKQNFYHECERPDFVKDKLGI